MDYSYNYKFLKQFMDDNKLQKRDILEAVGSTDYMTLRKWMEGNVAMHTTAILKMCNYYNIPLGSFFFDGDSTPAELDVEMPTKDSQTLPTGHEKEMKGKGYGIVETHITERKVGTEAQSHAVVKGLLRRDEQLAQREKMMNAKENNAIMMLAKMECQRANDVERNRLISIIEQQQIQISELIAKIGK